MQTVIPVEDVAAGVTGTSWQQFYDTSTPASYTDQSSLNNSTSQPDFATVALAVGGAVLLWAVLTSGRR